MRIRIKVKKQAKGRAWMAVGALAAHAAAGGGAALPVHAQQIDRPAVSSPAAGQTGTRRFNIPAGTLDTVLALFRQATGCNYG